jgi:phosphoglycolate phosphatase-like HAD superfamily hydrolase
MPRPFQRVIALLLIPCLLADPMAAAALHPSTHPFAPDSSFNRQAMMLPIVTLLAFGGMDHRHPQRPFINMVQSLYARSLQNFRPPWHYVQFRPLFAAVIGFGAVAATALDPAAGLGMLAVLLPPRALGYLLGSAGIQFNIAKDMFNQLDWVDIYPAWAKLLGFEQDSNGNYLVPDATEINYRIDHLPVGLRPSVRFYDYSENGGGVPMKEYLERFAYRGEIPLAAVSNLFFHDRSAFHLLTWTLMPAEMVDTLRRMIRFYFEIAPSLDEIKREQLLDDLTVLLENVGLMTVDPHRDLNRHRAYIAMQMKLLDNCMTVIWKTIEKPSQTLVLAPVVNRERRALNALFRWNSIFGRPPSQLGRWAEEGIARLKIAPWRFDHLLLVVAAVGVAGSAASGWLFGHSAAAGVGMLAMALPPGLIRRITGARLPVPKKPGPQLGNPSRWATDVLQVIHDKFADQLFLARQLKPYFQDESSTRFFRPLALFQQSGLVIRSAVDPTSAVGEEAVGKFRRIRAYSIPIHAYRLHPAIAALPEDQFEDFLLALQGASPLPGDAVLTDLIVRMQQQWVEKTKQQVGAQRLRRAQDREVNPPVSNESAEPEPDIDSQLTMPGDAWADDLTFEAADNYVRQTVYSVFDRLFRGEREVSLPPLGYQYDFKSPPPARDVVREFARPSPASDRPEETPVQSASAEEDKQTRGRSQNSLDRAAKLKALLDEQPYTVRELATKAELTMSAVRYERDRAPGLKSHHHWRLDTPGKRPKRTTQPETPDVQPVVRPQAVFFDLDGTLVPLLEVGSAVLAEFAWNILDNELSGWNQKLTPEEQKRGREHVNNLVSTSLPAQLGELMNQRWQWFSQRDLISRVTFFGSRMLEKRKESPYNGLPALFPGVLERLAELHQQGIRVYILSQAPQIVVDAVVEHHQLARYLTEAIGLRPTLFSTFLTKAEEIQQLQNRHRWNPAQVIMVGDGLGDMVAASAVGVKGIFITPKKVSPERLAIIGADAHSADIQSLPEAVRSLGLAWDAAAPNSMTSVRTILLLLSAAGLAASALYPAGTAPALAMALSPGLINRFLKLFQSGPVSNRLTRSLSAAA